MLQVSAGEVALQSFLVQVVWRLGHMLEYVVMRARRAGNATEQLSAPRDFEGLGVTDLSGSAQDPLLSKSVNSAAEASRGRFSMSVATDKGSIGGTHS